MHESWSEDKLLLSVTKHDSSRLTEITNKKSEHLNSSRTNAACPAWKLETSVLKNPSLCLHLRS